MLGTSGFEWNEAQKMMVFRNEDIWTEYVKVSVLNFFYIIDYLQHVYRNIELFIHYLHELLKLTYLEWNVYDVPNFFFYNYMTN